MSWTLFFPVRNYSPHTFHSERILESHNLTLLPTVEFPRPVLSCIWQREYPSLRREMTEERCAAEMAFMVVVRGKNVE